MTTSDKRKAQNRKSQSTYRVKMNLYITSLLETIERLKAELEKYKN